MLLLGSQGLPLGRMWAGGGAALSGFGGDGQWRADHRAHDVGDHGGRHPHGPHTPRWRVRAQRAQRRGPRPCSRGGGEQRLAGGQGQRGGGLSSGPIHPAAVGLFALPLPPLLPPGIGEVTPAVSALVVTSPAVVGGQRHAAAVGDVLLHGGG